MQDDSATVNEGITGSTTTSESLNEATIVNKPMDISPDKDGAIMKVIKKEGRGWEKPGTGDSVEVHYIGILQDGTIFDSSVERGSKFSFTLGRGEVIKGWDIGVASMRRGEVSVFTLAPQFAYGEAGSPPNIPPNSTLTFEIELFDWRMEDLTKKKDGGVLKSIKTEGSGYSSPNEGSTVTIHLKFKYGDRLLEEKDVSFIVGEASEANLVEGIDLAVAKMKKGEVSSVIIKRGYAWRDLPPRSYNLPEDYDQVTAEVTLVDFEKRKESWEMDEDERVKAAEYCKNRGSDFFKQGKYSLALKQYRRTVQHVGPHEASAPPEKTAVLLAGYLNLALTYLKLNRPLDAKDNANLALEIEPENVKGLFRRGLSYLSIKEYEKAKADFERVIQLDPGNKAAKVELANTVKAMKDYRERERRLYGNMFNLFAERDREREQKLQGDVWKELSDEQQRDFKDGNNASAHEVKN